MIEEAVNENTFHADSPGHGSLIQRGANHKGIN
jgi:hypothetical protein